MVAVVNVRWCQVVVLAKNQPPTKTSNYTRFRWRLVMVMLLVADVPLRLAFRAREGVCQCVSVSVCQHCST